MTGGKNKSSGYKIDDKGFTEKAAEQLAQILVSQVEFNRNKNTDSNKYESKSDSK